MHALLIISQLIIAFGIYNVWLLRYRRETNWRGGDSKNMAEEFAVYGYPEWVRKMTRATKLGLATLLLVGIFVKEIAMISAGMMALLMLVAIISHLRVQDPLLKSLPAASLLSLSLFVAYGNAFMI